MNLISIFYYTQIQNKQQIAVYFNFWIDYFYNIMLYSNCNKKHTILKDISGLATSNFIFRLQLFVNKLSLFGINVEKPQFFDVLTCRI